MKYVDYIFDLIIEEDFNADAVQCGLIDAYYTGCNKGMIRGFGIGIITSVAISAMVFGISKLNKIQGKENQNER